MSSTDARLQVNALNAENNRLRYEIHTLESTIRSRDEKVEDLRKDVTYWRNGCMEQNKFQQWLRDNHPDIVTTYHVLERLGES